MQRMEQSEQDVNSNLHILRAIQKDESSREQSKETKESKEESLRLKEVDKGGCSSTTTEELQLSAEDDEFYHGLVPKEDLPFLLREVILFFVLFDQGVCQTYLCNCTVLVNEEV